MKTSNKSLVAKLLASENITVIQDNVKTASFDVKARVLTLPVWLDGIESYVEDHMTGHEVGHALFTPLDGWHDAVCDKGTAYKSFLNVVEDARIEKLIQRKYPGLRSTFVKSYRSLFAKGFFGADIQTINKSSLIDRINTHFKCGESYGVVFDESEQCWLEEIAAAETWEQVEELTNRLYDHIKSEEEKSKEERDQEIEEDEEGESIEEWETVESEDDDEMDEFERMFTEGTCEGNTGAESPDSQTTEKQSDEPAPSETDEQLRENIGRELNDTFDGKIHNYKIYDYSKLWKRYVVGYKDILEEIRGDNQEEVDEYRYSFNPKTLKAVSEVIFTQWKKTNIKSVNNMVKEFEMRKSAANFARGASAKTGVLDTVKMNNYKMTDDIFKKVTIVPDGKNHGFIMYLDMSGSMSNIFHDTVAQTLLMVHFARQINVPFKVYGFSDSNTNIAHYEKNIELHPGIERDTLFAGVNVQLLELFTSQMNKREIATMGGALLCQGLNRNVVTQVGYEEVREMTSTSSGVFDQRMMYHELSVSVLGLGGTPLDSSLLLGIYAGRHFKKENQIDILNTIFLTDGASHRCLVAQPNRYKDPGTDGKLEGYSPMGKWSPQSYTTITFEGRKHMVSKNHDISAILQEIYRDATQSRTIGFYIIGNGASALRKEYWYRNTNPSSEVLSAYNKNGYDVVEIPGIDQQFYLPMKSLKITTNNMEEVSSSDSKAKLKSAFRKGALGSRKSRKMLTELAKAVA